MSSFVGTPKAVSKWQRVTLQKPDCYAAEIKLLGRCTRTSRNLVPGIVTPGAPTFLSISNLQCWSDWILSERISSTTLRLSTSFSRSLFFLDSHCERDATGSASSNQLQNFFLLFAKESFEVISVCCVRGKIPYECPFPRDCPTCFH